MTSFTSVKRRRAAKLGFRRKTRSDVEDLIGRRYFWLTVLARIPTVNSPRRNSRWICQCVCGATHVVDSDKLKSGEIKSCGCYRRTVHVYYARSFLNAP